jgi:hypothetical protein
LKTFYKHFNDLLVIVMQREGYIDEDDAKPKSFGKIIPNEYLILKGKLYRLVAAVYHTGNEFNTGKFTATWTSNDGRKYQLDHLGRIIPLTDKLMSDVTTLEGCVYAVIKHRQTLTLPIENLKLAAYFSTIKPYDV